MIDPRTVGRALRAALFTLLAMAFAPVSAQTPARAATDPLAALGFLEGTWAAQADGAATVAGHYVFSRELDRHVLARHAAVDSCKGPADFDCDHGDLFYVYADWPGEVLKAIYFDNEGHVIHYGVSLPSAREVEFLSEPAPGPRFRLGYVLDGATMKGKFQMQRPGESTWNSYLEWSGARE